MATINKTMKTFNVPDGNNTKCYEIVDDKGRKCIAKDWASNSGSAFAVGEYVIKDGVCYKFTSAHTAGSAWSASEVTTTNLGNELRDLKSAIGTVPTGKTVQGQIEALQTGKADMIVVTDSTPAAIKSFQDGADGLPMALKVAVEPVQDLHGYDNPWPAGGGKNILSYPYANSSYNTANVTGTVQSDGKVLVNSSGASDTAYLALKQRSSETGDSSLFLSAGDYKVSGGINNDFYIRVNTDAGVVGESKGSDGSFTIPSGGKYVTVQIVVLTGYSVNNVTVSPMIRLASVSDATWEPYSNICPISGWTGANVTRTGKNLLTESNYRVQNSYNMTASKIPSGVQFVGTPTWASGSNVGFRIGWVDDIFAKFGTTPKVLVKSDNSLCVVERAAIQSDGSIGVWCTTTATSSSITVNFSVMVYFGNTETEVAPIQGSKTQYEFPQAAGTVYGGTLDVTNGTLTVDRKGITVDENSSIQSLSYQRYYITENEYVAPATSVIDDIKVNYLDTTKNDLLHTKDWSISGGDAASHAIRFRFNETFETVQNVKDYLATHPLQIVYPLANPIVYQLTTAEVRTLLGQNNIWADTGDILSVDYPADTKLYIDGKFASLQALILENISNT